LWIVILQLAMRLLRLTPAWVGMLSTTLLTCFQSVIGAAITAGSVKAVARRAALADFNMEVLSSGLLRASALHTSLNPKASMVFSFGSSRAAQFGGNGEDSMKMSLLLLAAAAFAVAADAADAPKASCINPHQSYLARPLNNHEIYVENTMGPKKPPVRLTTSCYHLVPALGFGLSSDFQCIGQGDTVVATLMGDRQICRVTKVAPYVAQKDDFPRKTESKPDAAKAE
jgi:hypothetical protein